MLFSIVVFKYLAPSTVENTEIFQSSNANPNNFKFTICFGRLNLANIMVVHAYNLRILPVTSTLLQQNNASITR